MKIAQVSPIWERVPPVKYGGTQRVVYQLTEELVRQGHEVTLFASGDSKTSAKLISTYPRALYRDGISWSNHLYPMANILAAFEAASKFDILHCHIDRQTEYIGLALAGFVQIPAVFTLHCAAPDPEEKADRYYFLHQYSQRNFIAVSQNQRRTFDYLNFRAVVHNGIDLKEIKFWPSSGDYLVWLGRITPSKGAKEAIMIAKKARLKLVLAGKIDQLNETDIKYYRSEVEPMIDQKQIKYIGEIDSAGRNRLFAQAKALLNPIQWEEPFGLNVVEALASGLPVVTFPCGAMAEIITNERLGYLARDQEAAVKAIGLFKDKDRSYRRRYVEQNFSTAVMTRNYIKLYEQVIKDKKGARGQRLVTMGDNNE